MKKSFILVCFLIPFLGFSQKKSAKPAETTKPFTIGVIDEIQSRVLNEKRILNIYLPEGFKQGDTVKYPVVYLLDGSVDEDFIHIAGLYQFNSFPWINRVAPTIVVGIATVDRRRDFTYPSTIANQSKRYPTTGHSESFISFIEKELQPYIEKKYPVNSSKTLIGQSLGGLVATEILFKKPALFNKYIIVSPSLWWDTASLLKLNPEILNEAYTKNTQVYIAVGKEGLVPGDFPRVMEVDANMLADKVKESKSKNVKVYFDYLPEEDHATILHQAAMNALKVFHADKEELRR